MTDDLRYVLISSSAEETIAMGKLLGESLEPGDIVALTGKLGAGKTVLVKGIAQGLGFGRSDLVTSPTYKVLNRYEGRVSINHFDAFRLAGPGDFADVGGEDMLSGNCVSIIEWAERIEGVLPPDTIRVLIQVQSYSERKLEFILPESRRELGAVLASAHLSKN